MVGIVHVWLHGGFLQANAKVEIRIQYEAVSRRISILDVMLKPPNIFHQAQETLWSPTVSICNRLGMFQAYCRRLSLLRAQPFP